MRQEQTKWHLLREAIAINKTATLLTTVIIMFGFYIQFHGELSPGGGFQAGIIFASVFILYDCVSMVMSPVGKFTARIMPITIPIATKFSSAGVLIYGGTGILTFFLGGGFLDYTIISQTYGGKIGLFSIELGVASTVFGSVLLIYLSIRGFLITETK